MQVYMKKWKTQMSTNLSRSVRVQVNYRWKNTVYEWTKFIAKFCSKIAETKEHYKLTAAIQLNLKKFSSLVQAFHQDIFPRDGIEGNYLKHYHQESDETKYFVGI